MGIKSHMCITHRNINRVSFFFDFLNASLLLTPLPLLYYCHTEQYEFYLLLGKKSLGQQSNLLEFQCASYVYNLLSSCPGELFYLFV